MYLSIRCISVKQWKILAEKTKSQSLQALKKWQKISNSFLSIHYISVKKKCKILAKTVWNFHTPQKKLVPNINLSTACRISAKKTGNKISNLFLSIRYTFSQKTWQNSCKKSFHLVNQHSLIFTNHASICLPT